MSARIKVTFNVSFDREAEGDLRELESINERWWGAAVPFVTAFAKDNGLTYVESRTGMRVDQGVRRKRGVR